MAILEARELWQGRDGEDGDKARRYTRVWRVRTDSNFEPPANIYGACGIQRGDPYPGDPGAWCQRASKRNESFSPKIWQVTFGYSSEKELQPNPLNDPAEITWSDEQFQRPLVKDRNGKKVVNKAGDWFDPPYMIDDSRLVATVVKNVAAVPAFILTYRNVINSDPFNLDGIPVAAGCAKIKAIQVSKWQERNNIRYRTLTMPISLNADGWKVELLNLGLYQLVGGARKPCVVEGKCVSNPVPLDINGVQIANPTIDNVVTLEFDAYGQAPFSVLPLV